MTHDEPHGQGEPPHSSLVAILGREEEGLSKGRSPRTRFNAHGRRVLRDQWPTRRDHPSSNAHHPERRDRPRGSAHGHRALRRKRGRRPKRRETRLSAAPNAMTILSAATEPRDANTARRAPGRGPQ